MALEGFSAIPLGVVHSLAPLQNKNHIYFVMLLIRIQIQLVNEVQIRLENVDAVLEYGSEFSHCEKLVPKVGIFFFST
jgi:hypothetical protein